MSKQNVGALFVFPSVLLYLERQRIVALAAQHRLPAAVNNREAVELGALVGYGVSIPDLVRRAATHVEKILKGARPGDLPIEGPTTFELVVNLRTARALDITIPRSVLLRADHLIE
jgi:putative ABC transport system substrate-binding protein